MADIAHQHLLLAQILDFMLTCPVVIVMMNHCPATVVA